MNKPLICTTILMSAALVAGAAVDADNIYHRIFRRQRSSNTGEKSDRATHCGQSAVR